MHTHIQTLYMYEYKLYIHASLKKRKRNRRETGKKNEKTKPKRNEKNGEKKGEKRKKTTEQKRQKKREKRKTRYSLLLSCGASAVPLRARGGARATDRPLAFSCLGSF